VIIGPLLLTVIAALLRLLDETLSRLPDKKETPTRTPP
jgi:hypothetical protein